jgi:uncharacterized protein (TIGR02996 family)
MHTDADFLKMLLADPADDTTRLVYADWLEEQGDAVSAARAEFLRLTVRLATTAWTKRERKKKEKRLQELAAGLLDTDWLAVVSRLPIENCHDKRAEEKPTFSMALRASAVRFEYVCDRRWEDLRPTEDGARRFCDACRQNVHYCDTILEARTHARAGHCIAVDLGVIRRDSDLRPLLVQTLGRPSPAAARRDGEQPPPDPVSLERERRKQDKKVANNG